MHLSFALIFNSMFSEGNPIFLGECLNNFAIACSTHLYSTRKSKNLAVCCLLSVRHLFSWVMSYTPEQIVTLSGFTML